MNEISICVFRWGLIETCVQKSFLLLTYLTLDDLERCSIFKQKQFYIRQIWVLFHIDHNSYDEAFRFFNSITQTTRRDKWRYGASCWFQNSWNHELDQSIYYIHTDQHQSRPVWLECDKVRWRPVSMTRCMSRRHCHVLTCSQSDDAMSATQTSALQTSSSRTPVISPRQQLTNQKHAIQIHYYNICLLYTSPSPRD